VGVTLLDSSAVIAYLYADDALHEDTASTIETAIRDGAALAISAVSWAELLNGASTDSAEREVVRGFVTDFGIAIVPVDAQVAERAAALQGAYARRGRGRDRPKLRTPDALILATADVHGDIDTVICGDAKWPKVPDVCAQVRLVRARNR
jgi:predicted nucleic acid-binding protein